MGFSEGLLTLAARLVGLSRQRSRPDRHAMRNSQADEDDDTQNQPCSDGYSTREIKKNALDIHRDSVNPIGLIRNVTLVSIVVREGFVVAVVLPADLLPMGFSRTRSQFHGVAGTG